MKLVKMFGLTAIVAVAAMAFVGASSASAESTVLCKEHPVGACPAGQIYTGHVEALSTSAVLKASFVTVTCTHSKILGEALGLASPLVGHITELTFTGCSCPVTVVDQTGLLNLLKTALNLGTAEAEGFEVLVECSGLHCRYGGVVTANLHAEGSTAAHTLGIVKANEAVLKKLGGNFLCPSTSTWTASYSILLPDPIYIAS